MEEFALWVVRWWCCGLRPF